MTNLLRTSCASRCFELLVGKSALVVHERSLGEILLIEGILVRLDTRTPTFFEKSAV
jgi:hypothetical protein